MLRRGRLFTVAEIGDGALKPISSHDAFGPDIDPRSTWYDELLVNTLELSRCMCWPRSIGWDLRVFLYKLLARYEDPPRNAGISTVESLWPVYECSV